MNVGDKRPLIAPLKRSLLVCMLGYSALATSAAINETEPNNTISSPQFVHVPADGLNISAAIGDMSGGLTTDIDFFKFEATQGDTPTITIEALKPDSTGACLGFPANLSLYDAFGNQVAMSMGSCDPLAEARISNATLSGGAYTLAVGAWTHTFLADGEVENADVPTPGGDYKIMITSVRDPNPPADTPPPPPPVETPPSAAKNVPIIVKHWRNDESDIPMRRGRHAIVVAILAMQDFDAKTVDPASLTFGATGSEPSLFRCRKRHKDVNRDGMLDTVCYFKPDIANFKVGDLNGVLKGKTMTGQRIQGTGALKIYSINRERRGFKPHGRHQGGNKSK